VISHGKVRLLCKVKKGDSQGLCECTDPGSGSGNDRNPEIVKSTISQNEYRTRNPSNAGL
jgi:hypothetical protein